MEKKTRYSHQREKIYQCLKERHDHPSAETLYHDLRESVPGLSLATVYRNLKLLQEMGKIRRVTSVQGIERYEVCCEDHAHLLCTCCGRVQDAGAADMEGLRAAIRLEEGFRPQNISFIITGLCPACAAAEAG